MKLQVISWTPSASGSFGVTVEASNGVNSPATQSFTIDVIETTPIPAGLVAYWKLNETAGNTYVDFTGTNDGTGNPSPLAVAGQVNGAQQFDGTNQIDVPASSTFDFPANGNFSVEFWYKGAASTSTQMIVSRVLSGKYWYIGIINGTVRFSISGGGDYILTQGSAINDNQWHYVTATRNGTTGESKIYVDGSLKGTTVIPLTVDLALQLQN